MKEGTSSGTLSVFTLGLLVMHIRILFVQLRKLKRLNRRNQKHHQVMQKREKRTVEVKSCKGVSI